MGAIESIAPKIGCVPQTLNEWVKQTEVDAGVRAARTNSRPQPSASLALALQQAAQHAA